MTKSIDPIPYEPVAEPVAPAVADRGLARAAAGVVLASFVGPTAPPWALEGLADGLAGVVLFGSNVVDPEQLAGLSATLRGAGDEPVVAIDEEGGDVTRLAHATGSPYPGNAALGAADDPALTRQVYRALGAELAAVGVTLDLAPSVDVNTAADNPIIGTRAFSDDPQRVARHGAAAVAGLHDVGVAACVKHFPGHGATREDSHLALPTVDVPLDVLRARELVPFRAALAAGARCVMTAHIRIPELTGDRPATLSAAAMGTLLREELGFDGVVVTDALDMHGASAGIGVPAAAAEAFVAGADLLCLGSAPGPAVVAATVAAVAEAVRQGRVPADRLDRARERIAALRRPPGGTLPVDRSAALRAARAAVRLHGAPPVLHRPLVAQLVAPATIAAGPVPWGITPWLPPGGGEVVEVEETGPAPAELLSRAAGRSLVVVVRDAHRYPWMATAIERLVAERPDAVVVEMGLPVWRPEHGGAYLATHGAARANAVAALEVLGTLPRPA
jgi:beta-N-acetylhexosaminidase